MARKRLLVCVFPEAKTKRPCSAHYRNASPQERLHFQRVQDHSFPAVSAESPCLHLRKRKTPFNTGPHCRTSLSFLSRHTIYPCLPLGPSIWTRVTETRASGIGDHPPVNAWLISPCHSSLPRVNHSRSRRFEPQSSAPCISGSTKPSSSVRPHAEMGLSVFLFK